MTRASSMATALSFHPGFITSVFAAGGCASGITILSRLITVVHAGSFFLSPNLEALFHFGWRFWTELGALFMLTSRAIFTTRTIVHASQRNGSSLVVASLFWLISNTSSNMLISLLRLPI